MNENIDLPASVITVVSKNSLRTGVNSKDVNTNLQTQICVKSGKLQIWHHPEQLSKTLT